MPKGRVLRIVDATDIQEPGSTGTDWRLHYSLRLPQITPLCFVAGGGVGFGSSVGFASGGKVHALSHSVLPFVNPCFVSISSIFGKWAAP